MLEHALRRVRPCLLVLAIVACDGGATGSEGATPARDGSPPAVQSYEIVRVYPHDPGAFTQGLTFADGFLYEGTGRRGQSTLRKVRLETGEVLQSVDLPAALFGEGITLLGDRIYQLTWTSGVGLVYDRETFRPLGQFRQLTEGWGLTDDGEHLVLSDGSPRLYFLDPEDMSPVRTVEVREEGRLRDQINELEYVDGEVWANVWHSDEVLRISPRDGTVLGKIDFGGLLDPSERRDPEAVLNGIAHDPDSGRLFVTGKLWPKLFEVRVRTP